MKVMTAEQMREADRQAMELGFPGLVLMENAGCRFVEVLAERFAPLREQRILVVCGKGNNGGDGLVIARQLHTRFAPRALDVVLAAERGALSADAAANLRMLEVCGCRVERELTPAMQASTLIVDALLGTGLRGPAEGEALAVIRALNEGFPLAARVAVDTPSGLHARGECVRVELTVTFTAPKLEQVMPPGCDRVGELVTMPIGIPASALETSALSVTDADDVAPFRRPRAPGAHKGDFGHVLVMGGAVGKGGAAAMAGLAALRAGAGLVTVAAGDRAAVASAAPELMTEEWGVDAGRFDVIAAGPGLGAGADAAGEVMRLYREAAQPMVLDADGLNALAADPQPEARALRVLTPHPGEMARLAKKTTAEVQADRLEVARAYAREHNVVVVLKGQRTVTAFPEGAAWINPTGTPAMAKAGSGDILTGLIAGLIAQFPGSAREAVVAAVYLHGRAGERAAKAASERTVLATDLLQHLA